MCLKIKVLEAMNLQDLVTFDLVKSIPWLRPWVLPNETASITRLVLKIKIFKSHIAHSIRVLI